MICITDIINKVNKVIEYSQNIEKADSTKLIEKWFAAKGGFINAWGGNCIYEVSEPMTFYLSPEEKARRFNEFIESVDDTYSNQELTYFLDWLTIEEVFNNHLTRDYTYYNGKIPKETKVIKALKYFESNEEVLRKIQDRLSMILQEDKITGTLCLSVHPLDYLSVSENTYHWRSCHALDGDYRSGNLQYMVDGSTIVCYLRGADGVKLPNFPGDVPWNSKKWRMLLFLSANQQAMFAGRQYPFFTPSAMDCVQEAYLTSMNRRIRAWTPWYNDRLKVFPRNVESEGFFEEDVDNWLHDRYICMNGKVLSMHDLIEEPKRPLFFNDLTESSFYIPYYSSDYIPHTL